MQRPVCSSEEGVGVYQKRKDKYDVLQVKNVVLINLMTNTDITMTIVLFKSL